LDHLALAAHAAGGHTWTQAWGEPRLGLEYNYASGDRDPADDQHGTFDNLYPTNHKFYGYMDFVAWQNIHNLRLTGSLKPLKGLTLTLDYHAFWLADTADAFYQVNGTPRGRVNGAQTGIAANPVGYGANPGYDAYVGSEVDLVATYVIRRLGNLQVGYGHFFTGSYVDRSLAGSSGSTDADYVYAQVTLTF
jgi:hypothetical protein